MVVPEELQDGGDGEEWPQGHEVDGRSEEGRRFGAGRALRRAAVVLGLPLDAALLTGLGQLAFARGLDFLVTSGQFVAVRDVAQGVVLGDLVVGNRIRATTFTAPQRGGVLGVNEPRANGRQDRRPREPAGRIRLPVACCSSVY